jgi:hypothetical protein
MGHFCPPGSVSGFRIRIRIHCLIGSGSETLSIATADSCIHKDKTRYRHAYFCTPTVAAAQIIKDDMVRCLAILQYLTLSAQIHKKCSCECCHAQPEKLSVKYINAHGKARPKVVALINSFSFHHPSHYLCLYHHVSIYCGMFDSHLF